VNFERLAQLEELKVGGRKSPIKGKTDERGIAALMRRSAKGSITREIRACHDSHKHFDR
jgi:hypothetical protein